MHHYRYWIEWEYLAISTDTQTHQYTNNTALSVQNKKYLGKHNHIMHVTLTCLLFWTVAAGLHYIHKDCVYRPSCNSLDLSETDLCNMRRKSSWKERDITRDVHSEIWILSEICIKLHEATLFQILTVDFILLGDFVLLSHIILFYHE